MLNQIKLYVLVILVLGVLDYIWIARLMQGFYVTEMRNIGRIGSNGTFEPVWWAAVMVYLALAFGLCYFVLNQGQMVGTNFFEVFLKGFIFGLTVYAVYDFTNLSTLKDWGVKLALIDIAWGGLLCGATASIAAFIAEKIQWQS